MLLHLSRAKTKNLKLVWFLVAVLRSDPYIKLIYLYVMYDINESARHGNLLVEKINMIHPILRVLT